MRRFSILLSILMLLGSACGIRSSKRREERVWEAACKRDTVELAHANLTVFLDPAEETRFAVTKRLLEKGFLHLLQGGSGETVLLLFADDTLMLRALERENLSKYFTNPIVLRYPRERTRALNEELLSDARKRWLEDPAEAERGFGARELVLADDPLAQNALVGHDGAFDAPALTRWLEAANGEPDRRKRLRSILLSSSLDYAADTMLREWGVAELAGDHDPRRWDPADVALLVDIAKGVPLQTHKPHEIFLDEIIEIGQTPISTDHLRVDQIRTALSRMGRGHACDLLRLWNVPCDSTPWHTEHFPNERVLYESEWEGMKKRPQHIEDYVTRRWLETDEAAPHPDLDKVRAELTKLGENR